MNLDQTLISGHGISLPQVFSTGGQTAVIGMGIVFSVLIILMIVLYLFRVIFYREKTIIEPIETALPAVDEPLLAAHTGTVDVPEDDEEELIAVITAAIAASLNTSTYKLNIKSIRRVAPGRPAWNRAGLNETINNRF